MSVLLSGESMGILLLSSFHCSICLAYLGWAGKEEEGATQNKARSSESRWRGRSRQTGKENEEGGDSGEYDERTRKIYEKVFISNAKNAVDTPLRAVQRLYSHRITASVIT